MRSLRKFDRKTCISPQNNIWYIYLFDHVISDDLEVEYGHKVLRVILTGIRDPVHTDSLTSFAFSIVVLRANSF